MDFIGHASAELDMLDSSSEDVAAVVRERTGGHGADIVFNTVGSPFFELANKAMAKQGRQIFISTFDLAVPFDIFDFFRAQHRFIGLNTLEMDSVYCARIFGRLAPKFAGGQLRPFPIEASAVHGLDGAAKAYAAVERTSPHRVVLTP